jgi:hypothetical protein
MHAASTTLRSSFETSLIFLLPDLLFSQKKKIPDLFYRGIPGKLENRKRCHARSLQLRSRGPQAPLFISPLREGIAPARSASLLRPFWVGPGKGIAALFFVFPNIFKVPRFEEKIIFEKSSDLKNV